MYHSKPVVMCKGQYLGLPSFHRGQGSTHESSTSSFPLYHLQTNLSKLRKPGIRNLMINDSYIFAVKVHKIVQQDCSVHIHSLLQCPFGKFTQKKNQ